MAETKAAEETKQDKLKRLAGKRVSKALATLKSLESLAGYEPTQAQTQKLGTALEASCKAIIKAWSEKKAPRIVGGFEI